MTLMGTSAPKPEPNEALRILHLCWEYPPHGTGIGQYFHAISSGLQQLGHFSVMVTSRGSGLCEKEATTSGMIYRVYDRDEIGSRRVANLVMDIARQHRIHMIEAAEHLGEAAVLLRYRQRPPVMVNCRYNDVLHRARYAQALYRWQRMTIWLACLRQYGMLAREEYSIKHADLLAAPSHIMIESLRAQGLCLPQYTAVLPKPLRPLDEWENEEATAPSVLFVGRLDIGKGIASLPGLVMALHRQFPDLILEIAGYDTYARGIGSCRRWLEKRLAPVARHVRFLGFLNRRDLDAAYRRAWVIIVPSRWDTSPTSVLEAMVRSKAIVASPYGGMPEYLAGTPNAIAEPDDPAFASAVAAFLAHREFRKCAGEAGARKAGEVYTPEHCAARYVDFVKGALQAMYGRSTDHGRQARIGRSSYV